MTCKTLLGLSILLLTSAIVYAQSPFSPNYQPSRTNFKSPVSPYLNILRQGNSPAFNYTTLVRPQFQFQNSVQGLQNQVSTVQQSVITLDQLKEQGGVPKLPPTGVAAGFMNHRNFFMTNGGGAFGTAGRQAKK